MKRTRDEGGAAAAPAKRPSNVMRPAGWPQQQSQLGAGRLTTNDALSYLREVKNRFADDKQVYDTFLEIMKEFKAQRIDTAGVIIRVKDLFKGHRELILGFNTFLPKGYEIELSEEEERELAGAAAQPNKQPVEFDQAINYVNKIKNRFTNDERVYKAFLEILNMYRKGQKTIANVYEEVALLFRNHDDLLGEFAYFLPDSAPPQKRVMAPPRVAGKPSYKPGQGLGGLDASARAAHLHKRKSDTRRKEEEEGRAAMKGAYSRESQFFEKVKARLRNREQYQDLLKCLNLFATEIITKIELLGLVQDIIGKYPDIMFAFNEFLTRCEVLDMELEAKVSQRLPGREASRAARHMSQQEKYLTRPVSELDVSTWERCTTSYVMLPKGYPKLHASGRSQLTFDVMNDVWVSVTSGSEDYSFKHMRKNQYEEALFRCEDDRYELDLVIECNASAIRAMQPLAEVLSQLDVEQKANYKVPEGALNAIHYRCIEKIYGEQGKHVVSLLKQNPAVAIPVVLSRLQQKDCEWRRVKQDMNKLWAKVFEQNYHKSLDHRSFYFKQADKKNLGAKAMQQEIKDVVDKRKGDETGLQAVSAASAFAMRIHTDLEYDFADREVHEDVYKVIKYAVAEHFARDTADKVLEVWHTFVEPFYGLPVRQVEAVAAAEEGIKEHPHPQGTSPKAVKLRKLTGSKSEGMTELSTEDHADDESSDSPAQTGMGVDGDVEVTGNGEVMSPAAKKPATEEPATDAEMGEVESDDEHEAGDNHAPAALLAEVEDMEGDASSQDGDNGKSFQLCKPVAPVPSNQGAEAGGADAAGTSGSSVFYGNDTFYVLFRLHQHMYDRMRTAKKCAQTGHRPTFRQTGDLLKGNQETDAAAAQQEAERVHKEFMKMLFDLVDNTIDSSVFEDKCRALLGTNSYVLFTLDKLIYKMVKQLQQVVVDEPSYKLLELHRYEMARGVPFCDAVYHANSHVLLADDSCYRLEYHADEGKLTLQLMSPDKTEITPGIMEPNFSDYLKGLLNAPVTRDQGRGLFLTRNLQRASEDLEEGVTAILKDSVLANGLECKILTATSKVSYVLDTEDIFVRKKRRTHRAGGPVTETRARRFQQWLHMQSQLDTMLAAAEEAA